MRALDRKVLRDLWHLRGPAVAIAIVVACGVASFVTLRSMVSYLTASQENYYRRARFAEVFARVKRAPLAVARDLAALPGVSALELRTSGEVVLDVPGLVEPASGRVVGVPTTHQSAVNIVTVLRGRPLTPGQRDEVLVSEGFARANTLTPGDSLGVVLHGRWRQLHVAGIGASPEFIYELRPGDILPDNRHYGVLWMDEDAVAAAFGMQEAWNDAAVTLSRGASERAVIAGMDRLLDRYGSYGAYGRATQPSHWFVTNEIEENRTFAAIVPVIFLGVAAFLLNLVLSRIVVSQREQIGMLKAFGFGERDLVRHFSLLVLGPVVVGATAGCAIGLWAASGLAGIYADFFRIPNARFTAEPSVLLVAMAISFAAAVIGAVGALHRVLYLPAAEAMRPEAPTRYRRGLADRLGVGRFLSPIGRMNLRALERRPVRALLSVLGMALGMAMVIVGNFGFDAIGVLRDIQFSAIMRDDVAVAFTSPRGFASVRELAHLPGVLRVEPMRSAAVRLRHRQHSRQVAIVGVPDDAQLRRPVDARGAPIAMPADGVVLSKVLASALALRIGDTVQVEVIGGSRRSRDVRVAALLDDLVGINAYMTAAGLLRLVGAGEAIDGAALSVDAAWRDTVYARLKRTPGVSSVASRDAMVRNFDSLMEGSFYTTFITMLLFAMALASGVVYNTARIALSERGRELASLRVLGFTRGEVARMLFGEQGSLAVLALPAGLVLGISFCWIMAAGLESELFRFPMALRARTFVLSAGVLVASGLFSAILVRRRLDALDLVAVLKTRE